MRKFSIARSNFSALDLKLSQCHIIYVCVLIQFVIMYCTVNNIVYSMPVEARGKKTIVYCQYQQCSLNKTAPCS